MKQAGFVISRINGEGSKSIKLFAAGRKLCITSEADATALVPSQAVDIYLDGDECRRLAAEIIRYADSHDPASETQP